MKLLMGLAALLLSTTVHADTCANAEDGDFCYTSAVKVGLQVVLLEPSLKLGAQSHARIRLQDHNKNYVDGKLCTLFGFASGHVGGISAFDKVGQYYVVLYYNLGLAEITTVSGEDNSQSVVQTLICEQAE